MIGPRCDKCGEELNAYGAIILSPPETKPDQTCGREVGKYHICANCWPKLLTWLETPKTP